MAEAAASENRGAVVDAAAAEMDTGSEGGTSRRLLLEGSPAKRLTPQEIELVNIMRATVVSKDRSYRLQKYKRCFVANEAITWLVESGHASTRTAAVALCNRMLDAGLFVHVVDPDHVFEDKYLFFRCDDQMKKKKQGKKTHYFFWV